MKSGRLYLNGEIVTRRPRGSYTDTDENGVRIFVTRYVETLPNKARHLIYEAYDYWPLDNTPEFTVPADSYFVMGDNRDRSVDSRVPAFGTVASADIVARIPRRPVTLDLPW
jgi:signal peptidase I